MKLVFAKGFQEFYPNNPVHIKNHPFVFMFVSLFHNACAKNIH